LLTFTNTCVIFYCIRVGSYALNPEKFYWRKLKMKKFTKVLCVVLALAMVACMFAACSGKTPATDTDADTTVADAPAADYDLAKEGEYTANNTAIVIGSTGPLTGAASSYGISVKQGATLAVDEINANGGLNGINLVLNMKDDEAAADKATTGYNSLYEEGMQASIGSVTSGSCLAFGTAAAEDGVFYLTPSASAADVIEASDRGFRICFGDPQQGTLAAQELTKTYTNIGAIYDNSDAYSAGIYEAFKAEMATLNVEYKEQTFDAENKLDFGTQIEALKDCDVIFLPIYYTEASLIAKAATAAGCEAVLFGCDGLDGVAAMVDSTVKNDISYITPFDVASTDEKVAAFVTAYEDAFGAKPDQFAADAYDAVYVIYNAMVELGLDNVKVDPAELGAALTAVLTNGTFTYTGVTGEMNWDATGSCNKSLNIVDVAK